jgi:hypothetical protein
MNMIIIAGLAIMLLASTAAMAGSTGCRGTVVVGPEWTTVEHEATISLPKDHPRYSPPPICRFKTASPLGKRILRKCPNGSECTLDLSIANKPKDHRLEGRFYTIIKWPEGGITGEPAPGRSDRSAADGEST